jgi:kinesin family protein 5
MINSGIKVLCRFRPLNTAEATSSSSRLCISQLSAESVQIVTSDRSLHSYTFDNCWGTNSTQKQVYEGSGKPIVDSVLQGYNGAIIAYGQTGSGKTHTMMGPNGNADVDEEEQGLCPRSVRDIFKYMEQADEGMEFSVVVSFVEIYQEKVRDLLDVSKDDLKLGEHGLNGTSVYVKDVTAFAVLSEEEVFDIMRQGAANRAVAATGMNAGSSRSHSIFSITVTQEDTNTHNKLSGKLMLVDLAGSEQVSKTGVSGQQLEELKRINRSLSALGQVINSLTDGKSTHVPYRDSKLTRLLQDCLGGNSKTSLVILCSPSSYNEMETLSTLRFGKRAKSIKNQPLVNLERGPAEWKRYAENLENKVLVQQERISAWVAFAKSATIGNTLSQETLKSLASLVAASEKNLPSSSSSSSSSSSTTSSSSSSSSNGEASSTNNGADALLTPQRKTNHGAGPPIIASTPSVEMVDGLWTGSSEEALAAVAAREELERQNKNLVDLLKEAGAELKGAKAAVDQRDVRIHDLSERLKKAEASASLAAFLAALAAFILAVAACCAGLRGFLGFLDPVWSSRIEASDMSYSPLLPMADFTEVPFPHA